MKMIIWAIMSAFLFFAACDEPDGKWEAMKWSHPKYETVKVEGTNYFVVPVEGGSYGFRCKNYKPWLADHMFEANGDVWHSYRDYEKNDDYYNHYDNGWCRVDVNKDSVKVQFEPNTGFERKALIGVTAGDIFDRFYFLQGSAMLTEEGK